MAFTEDEKVRIRHHMGYMNVAKATTFVLNYPTDIETEFLLERSMTQVIPAAEAKIRQILGVLEQLENQEIEDAELLAVTKVDDIDISPEEMSRLNRLYEKWQGALANALGVPVSSTDARRAAGSMNVPVNHGGGNC